MGNHRLAPAFHLSLVTGLRRGELLALRWSDVDLDDHNLTVHQQLAIERGHPVLKQLKTEHADRVVTFGPATAAVLSAHRSGRTPSGDSCGTLGRTRVAVHQPGRPLGRPERLRPSDGSTIDSAGVPRITPKGLRHTAQSVGRVVVGDDKVMQERLGHADIGVTLNTYTHTVNEQHRSAGERLDEVFGS